MKIRTWGRDGFYKEIKCDDYIYEANDDYISVLDEDGKEIANLNRSNLNLILFEEDKEGTF